MIDVQNGHRFVGILGLTRKCARAGRSADSNLCSQHQNRGATEIGRGHEKTERHRVVIFTEGLAQIAEQYLHKGSKAFCKARGRRENRWAT
jgi:single-stranded DNA-binding protein